MAGEVFQPHDGLFRAVFGEAAEAADLLRAHVPAAIANKLRWSTLARQDTSFISNRLRASEAHLLIDQTQVGPDELRGGLRGRAAQLALMVPHREGWPVMERLVPLLAELVQVWGLDEVEQLIVYVGATTPDDELWNRFSDEVRRKVPGGGELMTKTQTMLELVGNKMRQEGRQEGEMITKVRNIEGLRGQGVSWSTIEAATGVDEDAFGRLKQQLQAAVGSTN